MRLPLGGQILPDYRTDRKAYFVARGQVSLDDLPITNGLEIDEGQIKGR